MVIAVRAHCNPLDIYIYIYIYILKLLRQSTVSALIGFISEAVDDQVETSAMK